METRAPARPYTFESPLGRLTVALTGVGALTSLGFPRPESTDSPASPDPSDLQALASAHPVAVALTAYFAGALDALDALSVDAAGTEFQRRVWAILRTIPAGTTWSYGQLAESVGSVARAVGTANGANPVGLVVPCHRVIGQNGDLVGYAGGLHVKRWLLRHEGALLL